MDLKEAKERLKLTSKQCHENKECWDKKFCGYCYIEIKTIFAIDRVLQELDKLQKENELAKKALIANSYEADEINTLLVKIQELQKENEEYSKQMDLDYVDENYINKDKLIETIDFAINATDSTDDYSIGLCNGMIYVKALLTDGNPDYKKCQNNSISKDKIYLPIKLIDGHFEKLEEYSINHWKNHFAYVEQEVAVKNIRRLIGEIKDLLKEE